MRTAAPVALALLVLAPLSVHGQIVWHDNLRHAHAEAEQTGKLLLLHFYSDNCVWCDKLEAGSFRAPEVAQAVASGFVAVKINASTEPELAKMFKVSRFPTDVVVTTAGKKLSHQVSPQDPAEYVAMLGKVAPLDRAPQDAIAVATPQVPIAAPSDAQVAAAAQTNTTQSPAAHPPATDAGMSAELVAAAPSSATDGTDAESQLAGFRNRQLSFQMPESAAVSPAEPPAAAAQTAAAPADPELAMEGFCAVTVVSEDKWVEGKPEFGVIHLGKLYLFENRHAMDTFLADPVPYTPVLNEIDVVRFFEERVIVPGKREWGVKDPNYQRMFFFADEAAMNHFIEEHHRYTDAAVEVMEKAVKDANPES